MTAKANINLDDETVKKLRALRRWHWQEYLRLKRMKGASFHFKQVQFLNTFFPPGDYAENDNK